jgi:hypothetical protein
MKDQDGKLNWIIGHIFNDKSAPAFTKIDGDEIGSCFAIQQYFKIPTKFCPKIAHKTNIVKGTEWESTEHNIALCVVPVLAPIPFGKNIMSISFDDSFIKEMSLISIEHGFWANLMSDIIEQAKTDSKVKTIVKRLVESSNKQNHDPCHTATKQTNIFPDLAPFINTSSLAKNSLPSKQFSKICLSGTPLLLTSKKFLTRTGITFSKIPVVSNRASVAQLPLEHDQQDLSR